MQELGSTAQTFTFESIVQLPHYTIIVTYSHALCAALVLCVVGVGLLHFMTRSFYRRVVRDQATIAQPAQPLQLRPPPQWVPDLEAQPPAAQPAPLQRPPVLVVHPDSKVQTQLLLLAAVNLHNKNNVTKLQTIIAALRDYLSS